MVGWGWEWKEGRREGDVCQTQNHCVPTLSLSRALALSFSLSLTLSQSLFLSLLSSIYLSVSLSPSVSVSLSLCLHFSLFFFLSFPLSFSPFLSLPSLSLSSLSAQMANPTPEGDITMATAPCHACLWMLQYRAQSAGCSYGNTYMSALSPTRPHGATCCHGNEQDTALLTR